MAGKLGRVTVSGLQAFPARDLLSSACVRVLGVSVRARKLMMARDGGLTTIEISDCEIPPPAGNPGRDSQARMAPRHICTSAHLHFQIGMRTDVLCDT